MIVKTHCKKCGDSKSAQATRAGAIVTIACSCVRKEAAEVFAWPARPKTSQLLLAR